MRQTNPGVEVISGCQKNHLLMKMEQVAWVLQLCQSRRFLRVWPTLHCRFIEPLVILEILNRAVWIQTTRALELNMGPCAGPIKGVCSKGPVKDFLASKSFWGVTGIVINLLFRAVGLSHHSYLVPVPEPVLFCEEEGQFRPSGSGHIKWFSRQLGQMNYIKWFEHVFYQLFDRQGRMWSHRICCLNLVLIPPPMVLAWVFLLVVWACRLHTDQIKLSLLSRNPPGARGTGPSLYLGSCFGSCFQLLEEHRSWISPGFAPIKSNCHCSIVKVAPSSERSSPVSWLTFLSSILHQLVINQ